MKDEITIRRSNPHDARDLSRLADLDEGEPPAGDSLLAFVDGQLRAALPLDHGRALADPFHHTADVVDLLRLRAAQERLGAAAWRRRAHAGRSGRRPRLLA